VRDEEVSSAGGGMPVRGGTDLLTGIDHACERGELSVAEADRCDTYAHLAYDAIRVGGWVFFRKSNSEE